MRRREFITLVGSVAMSTVAWPRALRAQQTSKLPRVGFLGASPVTWKENLAAFEDRLQALGWIDGRTVDLEIRWAEGHSERYSEIAAEFARQAVDVIVTPGSAAAVVKQATSTIPIVLSSASDPVASGLVASLARPGGNVTGLSLQANELVGKRIEFLHQIVADLRRIAILGNAGYPAAALEMERAEKAARTLGFEPIRLEVRDAQDIAPAIAGITGSGVALYGCIDTLVNSNQMKINQQALSARLPTMYSEKEFVETGGLISYGANIPALFGRAAEMVDKILKGAKPADIPVEQPTQFELIINLKTAKALGLTVPDSLVAIANEVIE